MLELLKKLHPLRLAPNSPDTDRAVKILCRELPFAVHEFRPGDETNGWQVPQSWHVEKASIRKDGRLIFDGLSHPLAVMGYAKSFRGRVDLETLKKHLTTRPDWPTAVGYHCDFYYKPWLADWGFSVPYALFTNLEEGLYDVELETVFGNGAMKVCDFFLSGETRETIVLNAHNCHAAQANDDVSGIVVGVETMKRLRKKTNRFSYRLIVCPEHLGTVFYLARLPEEIAGTFKYCFFLEALGNNRPLSLQKSFAGDTLLDRACLNYLSSAHPDAHVDDFRKIIGNDETVLEAPGYEIPTVSLSRFPFPEYHTSRDNEDIILESRLAEAADALLEILFILETNAPVQRRFQGLLALSNPRYDLYIAPGTDPSVPSPQVKDRRKWNYLMDCLPRYFDGRTTVLDMADRHELPYREVYAYVKRFEEKGLAAFIQGDAPKGFRKEQT